MGVFLHCRGLGAQGVRYQVVNETRELTRMTENVPSQGACNILLCKLKAYNRLSKWWSSWGSLGSYGH